MTAVPRTDPQASPTVAVVVPCRNEASNLGRLLPQLGEVLRSQRVEISVHVIDGGSTDGSPEVARSYGAQVVSQRGTGYGAAIRTALEELAADWVVTLDADCSHPPSTLESLLPAIGRGEIVIASRYVAGGSARMPALRRILSLVLNRIIRALFRLPVLDSSSGYRAYRREAILRIPTEMDSFAYLPEVLIKAHSLGFGLHEIPFHYRYRTEGASKAKILAFGLDYLRLILKLRWRSGASPRDL